GKNARWRLVVAQEVWYLRRQAPLRQVIVIVYAHDHELWPQAQLEEIAGIVQKLDDAARREGHYEAAVSQDARGVEEANTRAAEDEAVVARRAFAQQQVYPRQALIEGEVAAGDLVALPVPQRIDEEVEQHGEAAEADRDSGAAL